MEKPVRKFCKKGIHSDCFKNFKITWKNFFFQVPPKETILHTEVWRFEDNVDGWMFSQIPAEEIFFQTS